MRCVEMKAHARLLLSEFKNGHWAWGVLHKLVRYFQGGHLVCFVLLLCFVFPCCDCDLLRGGKDGDYFLSQQQQLQLCQSIRSIEERKRGERVEWMNEWVREGVILIHPRDNIYFWINIFIHINAIQIERERKSKTGKNVFSLFYSFQCCYY